MIPARSEQAAVLLDLDSVEVLLRGRRAVEALVVADLLHVAQLERDAVPALLVLDWQLGARPRLSAEEAGVLVSCLGWGGVVREV